MDKRHMWCDEVGNTRGTDGDENARARNEMWKGWERLKGPWGRVGWGRRDERPHQL
jgi:hypothetical protein